MELLRISSSASQSCAFPWRQSLLFLTGVPFDRAVCDDDGELLFLCVVGEKFLAANGIFFCSFGARMELLFWSTVIKPEDECKRLRIRLDKYMKKPWSHPRAHSSSSSWRASVIVTRRKVQEEREKPSTRSPDTLWAPLMIRFHFSLTGTKKKTHTSLLI